MPLSDLVRLLVETLATARLRSALTMLGIVVGMAAVVLLSSIGEGTRSGIAREFSQFGTTIVGVRPGKLKTLGLGPGAVGGTTHRLTVEDALVLRRIRGVRYVAPHVVGTGEVKTAERRRQTLVYGTVHEDQLCLSWAPRLGTFLPPGEPSSVPPVCLLGATVTRELFPGTNPLGEHVRIGGARFTVIGVMSPKGRTLGVDLDDMVAIPLSRALRLFDRDEVTEVHVLVAANSMVPRVVHDIRRALRERHDGEEDVTVESQADMLAVVDEVLAVLTMGVVAIAAISLVVGAIGILTMLWVSVNERTSEIGLMKAIGASDRQVLLLFLAEACGLSLAGGATGVALGAGAGRALAAAFPSIWVETPPWIVPVALGVSLVVGALAGALPAARAAALDPIEALRGE